MGALPGDFGEIDRFSLLPLRVLLMMILPKLSANTRGVLLDPVLCPNPDKQEQWLYSDWVCSDIRKYGISSSTFSSSMMASMGMISLVSFFLLLSQDLSLERFSQLLFFSIEVSCSVSNLLSLWLEMRFFSLMVSTKTSNTSWLFFALSSFHFFSHYLTRLSRQIIPYSSLRALTSFLQWKGVFSGYCSLAQMKLSSWLSLTSSWTILPTVTRMYFSSPWQQIFSSLALQLFFILPSSVAHLLMQEHRTSMLMAGGRSRMKLGARDMALEITLSRVGSKSTIERHPVAVVLISQSMGG